MAEERSALKSEIDDRRDNIATTVDQIENRVSPSRVMARRRDAFRQRLTGLRDQVMGSDETGYSYETSDSGESLTDRMSSQMSSTGEQLSSAAGTLSDAPSMARRQTKGNPAAAGLISFGAGLLIASVLPESRKEQELVNEAQPKLRSAALEAGSAGSDMAAGLQESAQSSVEELKESAKSKAQAVKEDATSSAKKVKAETQDQAKN